jgi:histidine triad (HIT) family protein
LDAHPDDLARMTKALLKIVPAILKETNSEGFNIIANNQRCAGQLVPHLHFHIVPRKTGDPIHFNWNPRPTDKDEIARLSDAIRKNLK